MRVATHPALLIAVAGLSFFALIGTAASGANLGKTQYPLQVIAVKTNPNRPKAGQLFIAMAAIVNQETGEPASGELYCPARIGRKGVRVAFKKLDTGVAGCAWTVPGKTGGKRLVASILVETDEGYEAKVPLLKVIRR